MLKFLPPLLAYLLAAQMSPLVSFNLTETDWLNVWTYVTLFAFWVALCVVSFIVAVVFIVIKGMVQAKGKV